MTEQRDGLVAFTPEPPEPEERRWRSLLKGLGRVPDRRGVAYRTACGLVVIGSSLALSCTTTDVCACEPPPAVAIIYGRVTDAGGIAVPQAAVTSYSGSASDCHATQADFGSILSAEDGSYRMTLSQSQPQDSVCVLAFARAPETSGVLADSDTVLAVLDFRFGLPQDSTRIDLSLQGR